MAHDGIRREWTHRWIRGSSLEGIPFPIDIQCWRFRDHFQRKRQEAASPAAPSLGAAHDRSHTPETDALVARGALPGRRARRNRRNGAKLQRHLLRDDTPLQPALPDVHDGQQRVAQSRKRELDLEEIRDLVLLSAKNLGVKAVGWSGGEFLVRKNAFDLLRLTVELGCQCKLCSNGELLSRDRLQAVEDSTCFFEPESRETRSEHEEETNRWFTKYLMVARHAGFYSRRKPPAKPDES